jgi:hypothetical protein
MVGLGTTEMLVILIVATMLVRRRRTELSRGLREALRAFCSDPHETQLLRTYFPPTATLADATLALIALLAMAALIWLSFV